jgi:hypothetical protein
MKAPGEADKMIRFICITGILFLFTTGMISAQDFQTSEAGMSPEFRRRALVMDINARVLDDHQVVSWNESDRRVAIPGSPVGIRLVGANVIVVVQFTPFVRRQGNVLVAQGQIWINNPGGGVSYYTSIQTIPMDFNEPIYFFPLGTSNTSLQIMLTVSPYNITEHD